jgi:hypothetical protein
MGCQSRVRDAKVFCCRGRTNRGKLGPNWTGIHVASCTSCLLDVFCVDNNFADSWASKDQETNQWRTESQNSRRRALRPCLKGSEQSWTSITIVARGLSRRRATSLRRARRCNKSPCPWKSLQVTNNFTEFSPYKGLKLHFLLQQYAY